MGEQVIARLNDLETIVQALQLESNATLRDELNRQITSLRNQLNNMSASTPTGGLGRDRRSIYNSKEFMPEKLGAGYRDTWRSWAYKVRDWLSQYDGSLPQKLLEIESKAQELTQEFIDAQFVPEDVDLEIKRFLIHRLESDPEAVVRSANNEGKSGLEQYRRLAQFCDPSAHGHNWTDAQHLFHPSAAPTLQAVPSRILEWKNLETRCKARSGESVPDTLRVLALLSICPPSYMKP